MVNVYAVATPLITTPVWFENELIVVVNVSKPLAVALFRAMATPLIVSVPALPAARAVVTAVKPLLSTVVWEPCLADTPVEVDTALIASTMPPIVVWMPMVTAAPFMLSAEVAVRSEKAVLLIEVLLPALAPRSSAFALAMENAMVWLALAPT